MICASCGETAEATPCVVCGQSPLLEGRYRLLHVLGRGAVGTTYAAEPVDGGGLVAIKEMPLRRAETDKTRELMGRELSLLRQLDHPGIPHHIEDFVAGTGKHRALYLVQEHIDGATLTAEQDSRRLDEAQVVQILDELLQILSYLHALRPPVIHRDLKPQNVMRRGDGRLVLIDFGAARSAATDPDLGGSTVAGTFGYMAPEQFHGDATPATDLYALGVLAAALLTREEPRAMLDRATLDQWLEAAAVSPPLRHFIRALTQPDPNERPPTADDARRRLRRRGEIAPTPPVAVTTAPTPTPTPTPPSPAEKWFVGGAIGLLALAGLGFAVLMDQPKPSKEATAAVEVTCADGPCRSVAEGQLKGIELGMTVAQATAAFPALSGAATLDAERVRPPLSTLELGSIMDARRHSVLVPGPHLGVETTLIEQPASCVFVFADEERASKMRCTIEGVSKTPEVHDQLTRTLRDALASRYGTPESNTYEEPQLAGTGTDTRATHTWQGDGAELAIESNFRQFMSMEPSSSLVVTLTSAAHNELMARLEAEVREKYAAARAAEERADAEEARALSEQLQQAGASDDL